MAPLSEDSIAIWHFPISLEKNISSIFWLFLSEEEKQKVNSFRFEKDGLKYSFCRGMLRHLLSLYTGIPPFDLAFTFNEYGKPYLARKFASFNLGFNLSHTSDYVVFAFGLNTEIGIDLEKIRPFQGIIQIVESFFSREEYLCIEQLKPDEQIKIFYDFWTKKEALLKAKGIGIAGEGLNVLKKLKIENENRIRFSDIHADDSFWSLQRLAFLSGYAGAIASKGNKREIEYQTFPLRLDVINARSSRLSQRF